MSLTRIVIVDDHAIVRQGLCAVIRLQPDMQVLGEAGSAREALELIAVQRPDLVLLDMVLPDMDGGVAITAIRAIDPQLPILALSTYAAAPLVLAAVQAGAEGYLLKDVTVTELIEAIRAVSAGRPYLHPQATRLLLQAAARPQPQGERLTEREQQVLMLLAEGLTNRLIGDQLRISEKTVSVHVSNILSKLQLESRTQAALYAVRMRLVPEAGG